MYNFELSAFLHWMKNLSLEKRCVLGIQPSIINSLGGLKLCTLLVASHSLQHINSRYLIGMSVHLNKVENMVNRN